MNNSNFPIAMVSKVSKPMRLEINNPAEKEPRGIFSKISHSFQMSENTSSELTPGNDFYDNETNSTKEDVQNSTFLGKEELIEKFIKRHPVELWKSFGLYEDSYLKVVDPHWLQFDPAGPAVHKILAGLYFIIMIIGCGGNLLEIFMFARCQSLRTPPNYLIINLAVSDFFLLAKMPIFIINSLYEGPVFGALGCEIYGFVGGLTGTASIMTLTAISFDRYFVIVYPLNQRITTSSRAFFLITFVWFYSFTFASLPLFGLNAYVSEGYLTSCSFDYLSDKLNDRIFVFVFFIAAWLLPLVIIVICYKSIYKTVKHAGRDFFHSTSNKNMHRESFKCKQGDNKTEEKIAVLSFQVIFIWACAWTPYAVVALFGITGNRHLLTPFASALPALFCKTASCIDPYVYAIKHPKFREELKNMFGFCQSDCLEKRGSDENNLGTYSTIEELHSEQNKQSRIQSGQRKNAGCKFSPAIPNSSLNTTRVKESKRIIRTNVEVTQDSKSVIEADEEKLATDSLRGNNSGGNQPLGHNFASEFLYIDESENIENPMLSNYKIVETHKIERIRSEADKRKVNFNERIIDPSPPSATLDSDSSTINEIFRNESDSSLEVRDSLLEIKVNKNGKLISIFKP